MHVLLTGGTGLIGRYLIKEMLIRQHNVSVVTRDVIAARRKLGSNVDLWSGLEQQANLNDIDVVINLAGEPIADKRWCARQKRRLCHSRWNITEQLVSLINNSDSPPRVLLSGSAIGFYGDSGDLIVAEDDPGQKSFTHMLCSRWETLALAAASPATRVCVLRTGVVLAKSAGALPKMVMPFKLGLGGPLGDGKQYLSWIHIDDMINAIFWLLENENLNGPVNMVAPYAVRNEQFASTLGRVLHRPTIMRTPAMLLRLLMGESATLILDGQHVIPKKLDDSGFQFRFRELEAALVDLL